MHIDVLRPPEVSRCLAHLNSHYDQETEGFKALLIQERSFLAHMSYNTLDKGLESRSN